MIFLIDYDRAEGKIRVFKAFKDEERVEAEKLRLELEIQARPDAEVVVLESDNEETVRKTHARYFQSAAELLRTGSN